MTYSKKNDIISKLNINHKRLERAREQGFDTDTIWYHVSNKDFEAFTPDRTSWLTRDLDSIKNGETGASLNSMDIFIHEFYVKKGKFGGWDEDDLYMEDQLIHKGFDGVILDDDMKLFSTKNAVKVDNLFEIPKLDISKEFNSKTIFYHGNENKTHKFSEIMPSFFTSDPEYAKGYGDYVYPYTIDTKKTFDTATDEVAREYYNNVFLKDELGTDAKLIKQGQHISANDADNFWAFITVEELMGNGLGYDSIIVDEVLGEPNYKTHLSIVPFKNDQIITLKQTKKPKFNK
jgi:hypothetical protein